MRDWTGIDTASLPPPTAPDFQPRVRKMFDDIDYFLRDLSRGLSRIQNGEVPDGSGNTIGSNGTLTDYWFKPGISNPFTAFMSTGSGAGGTISSTAHTTKGKILFGALSAFDEANTRYGVGTVSPTAVLHLDQPLGLSDVRPSTTVSGGENGTDVWAGSNVGNGGTGSSPNLAVEVDEGFPADDGASFIRSNANPVLNYSRVVLTLDHTIPSTTGTYTVTYRALMDNNSAADSADYFFFELYRADGNGEVSPQILTSTVNTTPSAWTTGTTTITIGSSPSLSGGTASSIGIRHVAGNPCQRIEFSAITVGTSTVATDLARWDTADVQTGRITVDGYLESRRLQLLGTTSGTITLTGGTSPTSHTYVLPTAQGAALTLLQNDGSGNLSWATGSSIVDVARTWSTLQKFPDDKFNIVGSSDATKIARFEVDGLTTATTRTFTLPNVNGTFPTIDNPATITGLWTFDTDSNDKIFSSTAGGHSGPGTGGLYVKDGASGFTVEIAPLAAGITADRIATLPDNSGEIIVGTATQSMNNKTLQGASKLLCNTGTGVTFQDSGTTTKQLRYSLSGLPASTTSTLAFVAVTNARTWTLPNDTGTIPVIVAPSAAATDLTGKTGAVTAATIYTTVHAGFYMMEAYTVITAFTAGGTITVDATWTDPAATNTNITFSTFAYTAANQNSFVTGTGPHRVSFYATSGTNIQVRTTFSGTATYNTYVRLTALT